MIVHAWTIVKDGAYFLPHWLRHYGELADRLFVMDDGSTDGTRYLVRQHPKATLLNYPFTNGMDDQLHADTFNTFVPWLSAEADWVMTPDIDEFLVFDSRDIRAFLLDVELRGRVAVRAHGVMAGADVPPVTDEPLWQACYYRKPYHEWNKTIVFKPGRVRLTSGQHRLEGEAQAHAHVGGITLYHCNYFGGLWVQRHILHNFLAHPLDQWNKDYLSYRLRRGCWEIEGRMLRQRQGWIDIRKQGA
jgi:hypothetical protein